MVPSTTLPAFRPPIEASDVTATALSLRAVQLYGKSPERARGARATMAADRDAADHRSARDAVAGPLVVEGVSRSTSAPRRKRSWRSSDRTEAGVSCPRSRATLMPPGRPWSHCRLRGTESECVLPARHRLPAADAVSGWLVARPDTDVSAAAAEGQRLPARQAPMDLGGRHELGGDGAHAVASRAGVRIEPLTATPGLRRVNDGNLDACT